MLEAWHRSSIVIVHGFKITAPPRSEQTHKPPATHQGPPAGVKLRGSKVKKGALPPVSLEPPIGTRDFYPEQVRNQGQAPGFGGEGQFFPADFSNRGSGKRGAAKGSNRVSCACLYACMAPSTMHHVSDPKVRDCFVRLLMRGGGAHCC